MPIKTNSRLEHQVASMKCLCAIAVLSVSEDFELAREAKWNVRLDLMNQEGAEVAERWQCPGCERVWSREEGELALRFNPQIETKPELHSPH